MSGSRHPAPMATGYQRILPAPQSGSSTGTRQHPGQRAIAQHPMVEQGRRGMKASDNYQRMREDLVHLLDTARERPIPHPGKRRPEIVDRTGPIRPRAPGDEGSKWRVGLTPRRRTSYFLNESPPTPAEGVASAQAAQLAELPERKPSK